MTRSRAALVGLFLLIGCGSPPTAGPKAGERAAATATPARPTQGGRGGRPEYASAPLELPQPKAWTQTFIDKALVLADEIRIEGPVGLIDHLALRSDDSLFDRQVETTEQGLRITVKPLVSGELVRGQLDNWQLSAIRSIVMTEAPGAAAVTVTALGAALWQSVDGAEERADRLAWRGEIE